MPDRMTQQKKILRYMESMGSITTMEAFRLGVTRLSARILELKKMGYNIEKEMSGGSPNYAIYRLGEERDV